MHLAQHEPFREPGHVGEFPDRGIDDGYVGPVPTIVVVSEVINSTDQGFGGIVDPTHKTLAVGPVTEFHHRHDSSGLGGSVRREHSGVQMTEPVTHRLTQFSHGAG
jgi:hypothetical protein